MNLPVYKRIITGDMFDICTRLTSIDPSYVLVRDLRRGRWEVHSSAQRDSLCVVVPFGQLDCRTLDWVRRTRSERQAQLIAELEATNQRNQRAAKNQLIDQITAEF